MKTFLACIIAVVACFPVGVFSQAASPASISSIVDVAAANVMIKQNLPGVAIAIVKNGTVIFERGYGFEDIARKTPVAVNTRFEIGSITKQFTAAAIIQLVRAGKISLDDPLGTYVTSYPTGSAVTVLQLLSQTSGIPEYLDGEGIVAAAGTQIGTLETILARIANKPLDFTPGTKWAYSNTNYILLGAVLERASHDRYDHYIRTHIFAPARMSQSGFISEESTLPAMARGYEKSVTGIVPGHPLRDEWAGSAGAIVSTIGDLAKWDTALTNGTIVAPADVALLQTAGTLPGGTSTSYGYGWFIDTIGGHLRISHNGGTFGFTATNAIFPVDGEAIIVLQNLAGSAPQFAVAEIFGALHPDVAITTNRVAVGEDPVITARVREWIKRFQTGDIDRTQLDASMSSALTPELVSGLKPRFGPLGDATKLAYRGKTERQGLTVYTYLATFDAAVLSIDMTLDAQGKIAGYLFGPAR